MRFLVVEDDPSVVRLQSKRNKQGRSGESISPELAERVLSLLKTDQGDAYASYEEMLDDNIARELARINLPLSLYTEMYWQMDLHNLFHFLRLRTDDHAQYEIRAYGEVMLEIVERLAPLAFEAFEEYILYGHSLSRTQTEVLQAAIKGAGVTPPAKPDSMSKHEWSEFQTKFFSKAE